MVIVVGVLTALSVDSWREHLTDRALEGRYLEQIVIDSRENLRLIAEATALEHIREARVRSAILGYVSQLRSDLDEFRREVNFHKEAGVRLDVRGEMALTKDIAPGSPRELRLYLAIVGDPEGRAALNTLRESYENRIWYLGQIEEATLALLDMLS